MKFGKQLQLGIYEPWRNYYVQYGKLKRIIKRLKFIADKKADKAAREAAKAAAKLNQGPTVVDQLIELTRTGSITRSDSIVRGDSVTKPGTMSRGDSMVRGDSATKPDVKDATVRGPSPAMKPDTISRADSEADENTPLNPIGIADRSYTNDKPDKPDKAGSSKQSARDNDDSTDFFGCLEEDIKIVNNFYVGKVAELRIELQALTEPRNNAYLTHHTSSDPRFMMNLRDIYLQLVQLKEYSDLCKTALYKIVKKYDKVLETNKLDEWTEIIDRQPFTIVSEPILLMEIVTGLVSRDKLIEWDRFATDQQQKANDDLFPSLRIQGLIISMSLFIISLFVPLVPADDPCAQRCASLLILVLSLWVTHTIPYYATAIMIPVLVTTLGVLKDPKDHTKAMNTETAANFVMGNIFNHTTLLLLGGYTISTAFSRCQLELRIAAKLQKYFGNSPKLFILAVMFLGLFLSMWISNHTAPILCATIILPVVRDLPTDSRFSKTLLLGLAYACNFGGMMTPISSMQNVLAVSYLQQAGFEVTFGKWILVSVPFCVLNTLLAWVFLVVVLKPDDITCIPIIVYERGTKVFGKRNIVVVASSLLTILLFANMPYVEFLFGEIGIVATLYVAFMYGSGILSEVDFNSLSWHTIFLVGGGNVLGKAVSSSGLLGYISTGITDALPLSFPWLALVIILLFCLAAATFVSHTVASLILMPVIATLGIDLGMPEVAVIGSAFAVSAAMALPFSSFPNVNSVLIVDDFQRPYLDVGDFMKTGFPLSVMSVFLIATFGYGLIKWIIV